MRTRNIALVAVLVAALLGIVAGVLNASWIFAGFVVGLVGATGVAGLVVGILAFLLCLSTLGGVAGLVAFVVVGLFGGLASILNR